MDADDRAGTSPEHFDRLACGVLSAARAAARELEREPQDADRRTWALGKLAGQAQAMLGPGLPDHPPVGAAAQEGFVRTALALAVHVRAHSWSERDLGAVGVPGQEDVPHPGERRSADAFDVLGRLMLPHALPEGWTATLVTDLARGDKTLEVAVKVGKYILHPTFLALTDDATRIIGEALHNINVDRLHELTRALRHYASAAEPSHPASKAEPTPDVDVSVPQSGRPITTPPESPDSERRIINPRWASARRRADSEPVPADPATQAPPEPPRHPRPPSDPGVRGVPGAPGFSCSTESAAPTNPATPRWVGNPVTDADLTEGDFRDFDPNPETAFESSLDSELAELATCRETVSDELEAVSHLEPSDILDEGLIPDGEAECDGFFLQSSYESGFADGDSRTYTSGFYAPRLRGFGL